MTADALRAAVEAQEAALAEQAQDGLVVQVMAQESHLPEPDADYSQILDGDPRARWEPSDAHRQRASEMFGGPVEEVTLAQRMQAKEANFADTMVSRGTITGRARVPAPQLRQHRPGRIPLPDIDYASLERDIVARGIVTDTNLVKGLVRIGQNHEDLVALESVFHVGPGGSQHEIGILFQMDAPMPDTWYIAILDEEFANQIQRVGQPGSTYDLPIGSVVAFNDEKGYHKTYYKAELPDTWRQAETDGRPTLDDTTEDWTKQSPPLVYPVGVYFQGVGMGWPVGASHRPGAQARSAEKVAEGRKLPNAPALRGRALDEHRKQRSKKRKATRAARRKNRK